MSELNASNLRKEQGNEGPDLVGTTELTSPYFMVPPSGTTAERPQNPQKGTLRFNTDIGNLEYFKGNTLGWESIDRNPNQNLDGGVRGVYGGASSPSNSALNTIDYITISTLGDAQEFGDEIGTYIWIGCCSSHVRGVMMCGYNNQNVIQYLTMSSKGDTQDFGDSTDARHQNTAISNRIRGIAVGGTHPARVDTMDYVTISQTGNAVDFGNLLAAGSFNCSGASNGHGGL